MNNNNKKFCVYEHIFPNGKKYIGITCKDPKKRWENGHGYSKEHQSVMYNAIKKYGWNNIKHNILFENLTEKEAKQKEQELIKENNTYVHSKNSNGYNMTLGGEGTIGHKVTEDGRKRMSKARIGKVGKECPNSKRVICDGIEYESLTDFKNKNDVHGKINGWLNGTTSMPKEWYDKRLHFKDTDFSIIKCRDEDTYVIEIDGKIFNTKADFARYIGLNASSVQAWFSKKVPLPSSFLNRNFRFIKNNKEINFEYDDKIIGWEYKGNHFKNLKELSIFLNIEKSKLWYYLKNPNAKCSKKYLPLKYIHKILL